MYNPWEEACDLFKSELDDILSGKPEKRKRGRYGKKRMKKPSYYERYRQRRFTKEMGEGQGPVPPYGHPSNLRKMAALRKQAKADSASVRSGVLKRIREIKTKPLIEEALAAAQAGKKGPTAVKIQGVSRYPLIEEKTQKLIREGQARKKERLSRQAQWEKEGNVGPVAPSEVKKSFEIDLHNPWEEARDLVKGIRTKADIEDRSSTSKTLMSEAAGFGKPYRPVWPKTEHIEGKVLSTLLAAGPLTVKQLKKIWSEANTEKTRETRDRKFKTALRELRIPANRRREIAKIFSRTFPPKKGSAEGTPLLKKEVPNLLGEKPRNIIAGSKLTPYTVSGMEKLLRHKEESAKTQKRVGETVKKMTRQALSGSKDSPTVSDIQKVALKGAKLRGKLKAHDRGALYRGALHPSRVKEEAAKTQKRVGETVKKMTRQALSGGKDAPTVSDIQKVALKGAKLRGKLKHHPNLSRHKSVTKQAILNIAKQKAQSRQKLKQSRKVGDPTSIVPLPVDY